MDNKKDFIRENLREEDLSQEQQTLLEFLGMEKYLEMCERFGGASFSTVKLETLCCLSAKRKILENREVYRNMKLTNKQLAAMYGISLSTVYNIFKGADR